MQVPERVPFRDLKPAPDERVCPAQDNEELVHQLRPRTPCCGLAPNCRHLATQPPGETTSFVSLRVPDTAKTAFTMGTRSSLPRGVIRVRDAQTPGLAQSARCRKMVPPKTRARSCAWMVVRMFHCSALDSAGCPSTPARVQDQRVPSAFPAVRNDRPVRRDTAFTVSTRRSCSACGTLSMAVAAPPLIWIAQRPP